MGETKLTIVIVSFNTRNVLQKCLTSITKSKINFDYTVIVSDNGSRDGSVELVKTKFPSVKLLENGKNLGFAVATKLISGLLTYSSNQSLNSGRICFLTFCISF